MKNDGEGREVSSRYFISVEMSGFSAQGKLRMTLS